MDVKIKSRGNSAANARRRVSTVGSGITDLSIKKAPPKPRRRAPEPAVEFDFDDDGPDDLLFGNLQNKSKTLPDDEYMLGEDEELVLDDGDDDDNYGGDGNFSDFSDDDEEGGDEEDEEEVNLSAPGEKRRSFEEVQMEKQHYLMKIERLKKQGFFPRRSLNLSSNLEDIKFEHECLFRERGLEKAIKEWREDVVLYAAGGERVNKWAKEPMHLENWSKQVHRDAQDGDYDPIFEQLHDKYGGSSMLPPEIQLVKAMGMSAIRFHFSHKVAKDAPNIHDMLERNPELRSKVYAELQREAVAGWAGTGQAPPTSGPGPTSMGPSGGGSNPLANGPPPPVQSRNAPKEQPQSKKMSGPSSTTDDLLRQSLEGINDDGVSFESQILNDGSSDSDDDMTIGIAPKRGRGRKSSNMNIATVDI